MMQEVKVKTKTGEVAAYESECGCIYVYEPAFHGIVKAVSKKCLAGHQEDT